jgi:hypothetical protein
MALVQVSPSERVDLEFYKGYPVINYTFEILNSDGTAYSFTSSTGVYFKLLSKKNGSLLTLIPMSFNSPRDNFIYLNDSGSSPSIIIQRTPRIAWYEVYSVESQTKLLFEGVAEI